MKQGYYIVWIVNKKHNKNNNVGKTKNGKMMLPSNCAVCNSKKLRFIKGQEAKGLLGSNLGIIAILGPLLM